MPSRRPARPDTGAARVPAAVTRPTRTGVQVGAGYLIAQLLDTVVALSDEQVLLIALLLTPFLSWVQVLAENRFGAGLLRKVPPADEPVDVPGEAGFVDPRVTFVVAVLALVVALLAFLDYSVVVR